MALRGRYDADPVAARQGSGAVFTRSDGAPLDRHTALRAFRKVIAAAGLPPGEWAPRETRHSFVSLLSDDGMALEKIARLVGHAETTTTETVYRKQIRPAGLAVDWFLMRIREVWGSARLGVALTVWHSSSLERVFGNRLAIR